MRVGQRDLDAARERGLQRAKQLAEQHSRYLMTCPKTPAAYSFSKEICPEGTDRFYPRLKNGMDGNLSDAYDNTHQEPLATATTWLPDEPAFGGPQSGGGANPCRWAR